VQLNKKQKEFVLKLAAEGLESDEINRRAAKSKEPFSVSRQQVDFYRKSRGHVIDTLKKTGELDALCAGLSLKDARVAILQEVTDKLLRRVRASDDFDEPTFRQLRGLLNDIAKETGGRKTKVEVAGNEGGPITICVEYEDAE